MESFVEVDLVFKHDTGDAVLFDQGDGGDGVWVPHSAIDDDFFAGSYEPGQVVEVSMVESYALKKGLI